MIVVDTSAIVALMNAGDSHHDSVSGWIDEVDEDLVTTPMVLAEVDHLVTTRGGAAATRAFYDDLDAGAYALEWWREAAAESIALARRYADSGLGLTDASLVALAGRAQTNRIATLDQRHFRAVEPLDGGAFQVLPADR